MIGALIKCEENTIFYINSYGPAVSSFTSGRLILLFEEIPYGSGMKPAKRLYKCNIFNVDLILICIPSPKLVSV